MTAAFIMGKSRASSHKPTTGVAKVHNNIMDMDTAGNHHDGNNVGDASSCASPSAWDCHTCTFLNKDAHRSTCSFCGAARDGGGGGGTISMSENEDNGVEVMSHGSKHSNDNANNKNSILRRCSTNNSESQQSASTSERERGAADKLLRQQKQHRRPSRSSSRSRLQPPSPKNNNSKPSSYRVKGRGRADSNNNNNNGTDDDGTSSSGNLINTSDVDSIRLIDSVSKASVSSSRNGGTATSRRTGRRGTVPTDDSLTLQSKSSYSRHYYQDETSFRRRRRSHDGSTHERSKSEQNVDQEERDIGSNKIWASEEGVKQGKKQLAVSSSTKTKSEGAEDDNSKSSSSSTSSSSGSGSITKSGINTAKTLCIPEGNVTIVYTDVQGSTSLWEADPYSMKKATDIHDSIIRRCYSEHGGMYHARDTHILSTLFILLVYSITLTSHLF